MKSSTQICPQIYSTSQHAAVVVHRSKGNVLDAIEQCASGYGGSFLPLNNQLLLDELKLQLRDCHDAHGRKQLLSATTYMAGLRLIKGAGMWLNTELSYGPEDRALFVNAHSVDNGSLCVNALWTPNQDDQNRLFFESLPSKPGDNFRNRCFERRPFLCTFSGPSPAGKGDTAGTGDTTGAKRPDGDSAATGAGDVIPSAASNAVFNVLAAMAAGCVLLFLLFYLVFNQRKQQQQRQRRRRKRGRKRDAERRENNVQSL